MKTRTAAASAAVLATIAVAAAVGAMTAWPTATAGVDVDASTLEPPDMVPPVKAPLVVNEGLLAQAAPDKDLSPERITIPAIDADMPITALGLAPDGSMALVERADTATWYKYGAAPGERRGAALIAAHVASPIDGVGPFSRLPELRGGDVVTVTMSDGSTQPFVVVKRQQISKQTVDYAAVTADSEGMLVMVTCGGDWDARNSHYEDNVIVWAASLVP